MVKYLPGSKSSFPLFFIFNTPRNNPAIQVSFSDLGQFILAYSVSTFFPSCYNNSERPQADSALLGLLNFSNIKPMRPLLHTVSRVDHSPPLSSHCTKYLPT